MAVGVTGVVSLVVGVGAAFVTWKWPRFSNAGTYFNWILPTMAFASVFLYRLFRAPLEILQNVHAEREAAERRREAAEDQLREKRHCQAIADALTVEYRYGVHEILHKPPNTEVELPEWNQWVRNWNQGV